MSAISLNYVWVNAVPHNHGVVTTTSSDPDKVQCPIPGRYLDNVRQVRQRYPDIDITIWMDAYKRNDKKGDLSRAFAKSAGVDGVEFRGLREIPEYRTNKLFNLGGAINGSVKGVVWKQVDLARLLVLSHAMEENGGLNVYADFDFEDPPVDHNVVEKANKHGILISRVAGDRPELDAYDPYVHSFENNVMVFSGNSEQAKKLVRTMIDETTRYYSIFTDDFENGWNAFCKAFRDFKVEFYGDTLLSELTISRKSQPRNHSDYPGFSV
jgi:hypothetical protein